MGITFPLAGSPLKQQTLPSFLYSQYADDDDLQAFVAAYNAMTQEYVDWFNQVSLPVYTGPMIAGPLLDWVGRGVYDIVRPSLPLMPIRQIGPLNTWQFNALPFNTLRNVTPANYVILNDDYYKRVLTWHHYIGDGKQFCIRWLKRRIARFLYGPNGTDIGTDDTRAISILVVRGLMTITIPKTTANAYALSVLRSAIGTGVLETPIQLDIQIAP